MKLIDQVKSIEQSDFIQSTLDEAVPFNIQNIARFYYEGTDQENWGDEDFPFLSPPYNSMWMEWDYPKEVRSNGVTSRVSHIPAKDTKIGVLVVSLDLYDEEQAEAYKERVRGIDGMIFEQIKDTVRWVSVYVVFIGSIHLPIPPKPSAYYIIGIAPDGSTADDVANNGKMVHGLYEDEKDRIRVEGSIVLIHPALLAISFTNCKNVEIVENKSAPKPRKRKDKAYTAKFYTLEIEAVRDVIRKLNHPNTKTGIKMALHTCRGHWKDYSKGKGLFGRLKGRFFWGNSLRGQESEGLILKDYELSEIQSKL
jgi:hypothetical protein